MKPALKRNKLPSASTESRAARLGDKGKRRTGAEGLFHYLLEAVPAGMLAVNQDGMIVRLNERAAKLFGYQPDELIGQQIEVLVPERFHEEHVQHRRSLFSKLRPREMSATPPLAARRKDGSEFPAEIMLFPLKFEQRQLVIAAVQDITDRAQSEESLRSREEYSRALIECSADIISTLERDGTIRYVSPSVERVLGYKPEELVGQPAFALVHPDDRAKLWRAFSEGITRPGHVDEGEYRYRHKDGSWRTLEGVGTNLLDNPALKGVVISIRDITERRRAEEALRDSEARYRRLYQSMMDAFASVSMDGRIREFNQSYQTMLGYSNEELKRLTYVDLTPARWHAFEARIIEEQVLPRGYSDIYEKEYRKKDGTVFPIELRTFLIRDAAGQPVAMWGIVRDITKRKRAEKALRESEERFRRLSEAAFEGIFIHEGGVALSANDQFCEMFGYQPDELLGKQAIPLTVAPESRDIVRQQIATGSLRPYEAIGLKKDGSRFPMEIRVRETKHEAQRIRIAVVRDSTERKRAEEGLRRANRALRVLGECNAALVRDTDEAALLQEVCRIVVEVGGYRTAWVGWAEQDKLRSIRPVAQAGFEDGYLRTVNIAWADTERGRGPAGSAIRTGQPVIARNIPGEPSYDPWRVAAIQRGCVLSIALPLRENAHTFGVLSIYAAEPDAFDTDEVKLLSELADDLAYGIGAVRARAERKRAEDALRLEQEKLEMAMQDIGAGLAIISRDYRTVWANKVLMKIFGDVEGRPCYLTFNQRDAVCPGCGVQEIFEKGSEVVVHEQVGKDSQGKTIWSQIIATPIKDAAGNITAALELVVPITERKRAEEELRRTAEQLERLSRRLLDAQETERRRLAGELHDEIGQALTMLKINLQTLERKPGAATVRADIQQITQTVELTLQQVRNLAVQLRPSLLDDLGLVPALRWDLDRVTQAGGLAAEFAADPLEQRLSPEVEIACFRVAQEALTNVVKHARAKQVRMELRQQDRGLLLVVRDDGAGFDTVVASQAAARGGGFGLLGMQERVALVEGKISIESKLHHGTEIRAWFPLAAQSAPEASVKTMEELP